MFKKPISLSVTIIGVTALGWAVACSSSPSSTGTSGTSGTSGSSTTGSSTTGSSTTGSSTTGSSTTGSSTTGSSTTGTTTGTSGSTTTDAGAGLIIDNMTSASGKIALSKGFAAGASAGFWYTFSDVVPTEKTLLTPPNGAWVYTSVTPPAGVASTHAACLTALPWSGYAAGIGFNFAVIQPPGPDAGDAAAPAAVPATYDTTPYKGVTFWAMGVASAGALPSIKIAFPDDQTHGADTTALCHAAGAGQCDDDFSDQNEALVGTWTQITIPFSTLVQGGYGGTVGTFTSWDAAKVWGVNIQVNGLGPVTDGGGTNNAAFGFCISDIQFTQ